MRIRLALTLTVAREHKPEPVEHYPHAPVVDSIDSTLVEHAFPAHTVQPSTPPTPLYRERA